MAQIESSRPGIENMKILITIQENNVAPRFDLTSEVLIADYRGRHIIGKLRIILMTRPSPEELCGLIIKEDISRVVCGGIEETHLQYLVWKKIEVLDSIIGPYREALDMVKEGTLKPGTILSGAKKIRPTE